MLITVNCVLSVLCVGRVCMQEGEGSNRWNGFQSIDNGTREGVGTVGLGARVWEQGTQENTGKEWQFSDN